MSGISLCLLFLVIFWPVGGYAQDDVLSWFVQVESAAQNRALPRTFLLFQQTDTVSLRLAIENESDRPVLIVPNEFVAAVRIALRELPSGSALGADTEWVTCTAAQDVVDRPALSGGQLVVMPGELVRCRILVRRSNGSRFRWGMYGLKVSFESVAHTLRDDAGKQWPGRFLPRTDLTIVIRQAAGRELAAQHLLAGDAALKGNRPQEAIVHFSAGLAADPNDTALKVGLGEAYLQTGRYREAATVYEQLVPALRGEHSKIFGYLAYAYTGAGDEDRARQALARGGVSEERIRTMLASFHDMLARESGNIRR